MQEWLFDSLLDIKNPKRLRLRSKYSFIDADFVFKGTVFITANWPIGSHEPDLTHSTDNTWLWWWTSLRLSKLQALLPTTFAFSGLHYPKDQTILSHELIMWIGHHKRIIKLTLQEPAPPQSEGRRACAGNVSMIISLRYPIHIINSFQIKKKIILY